MAVGIVDRQKLVNIADAVREKKGITGNMTLDAIASNITSMPTADNNANFDFLVSKSDMGLLSYLTTVDLSNFDTRDYTDMREMFSDCFLLTSLNVSKFDTSNVTNMDYMFNNCSSMTSLDVSNFNTINVGSMIDMFQGCSSLTSLDVSGFDTSKVDMMTSMFQDCKSLTSLDLSKFNTSNVTMMTGMFNSCSSLTSLDLSNFDTSKVISMNNMFQGCSSLTSLDLSNFDTSNVEFMMSMFNGCFKLSNLKLGTNWASNSSISSFDLSSCPLTHESAVDVINKLATRSNSPVIEFSKQVGLYQSEIDVATNKGWSVSGCTVLVEDPTTATVGQGAIIDGVPSKCVYVADTVQSWGQRVFIAVSSFTDSNGNSTFQWGGSGTATGITATEIGTGLTNTNSLIAMNLQSTDGTPTIWDAIKEFRNTHSDSWFVPSMLEITSDSTNVWSSSEYSSTYTWGRSNTGGNGVYNKNNKRRLNSAIYV